MELEAVYGSRTRPVILTDATVHWPARTKWSFDYFKRRFPTKQVRFAHASPTRITIKQGETPFLPG